MSKRSIDSSICSSAKRVPSCPAPSRVPCPYGMKCYRKNPTHFKQMSHPSGHLQGDQYDAEHGIVQRDDDTEEPAAASEEQRAVRTDPWCPYGRSCTRKNPIHFQQMYHPDSKQEEEEEESEEEEEEDDEEGEGGEEGEENEEGTDNQTDDSDEDNINPPINFLQQVPVPSQLEAWNKFKNILVNTLLETPLLPELNSIIVEYLTPSHLSHCWKPIFQQGRDRDTTITPTSSLTVSKLAGTPWMYEHEQWPKCGSCKRSLQFMLQLRLRDFPSDLFGMHNFDPNDPTGGENDLLQFWYCTSHTCDSANWEPFDATQLIRIVNITEPAKKEGKIIVPKNTSKFIQQLIVGWKSKHDIPHIIEIDEFNITYSDGNVYEVIEEKYPCLGGEKLSGWPCWVQDVEYPSCRRCQTRMRMIFQIEGDSYKPDQFMLGDCGIGHLTQCPTHRDELAFNWACG